jgi:predicted SAM-dependent methyltransferase
MTGRPQRFPIKRHPDGRTLLNLGSSARVAAGWNNVDSSWLFRIGRRRRLSAFLRRVRLISAARYERIRNIDRGAILWDLSKGIPFPDEVFDAVYHCHLLEHLDREAAPGFLAECFRVLKPGGLLRVVVPDLELLARHYLDVVDRLPGQAGLEEHTAAVEEIFDQMVRRIPKHRKNQTPFVRLLESLVIGNTARSGELHRWMYDRFSLGRLLEESGFRDVRALDVTTSQIVGWNTFGLDVEPDGSPYKPGSLYIEGQRP